MRAPQPGRPWTIRTFEIVSIITLIIDIVQFEVFWLGSLVFVVGYLSLILSITRWKSKLARAIYTAFVALGLTMLVFELLTTSGEEFAQMEALDWGSVATMIVGGVLSVWLVWNPATERWLRSSPQSKPYAEAKVR